MLKQNDELEKEFEKLSYKEIEKVLNELGTRFAESIKLIPK